MNLVYDQVGGIIQAEREFYLTPAAPGCGHMAAGTAERTPLSPAIQAERKFEKPNKTAYRHMNYHVTSTLQGSAGVAASAAAGSH